jgi:hypothetical protein
MEVEQDCKDNKDTIALWPAEEVVKKWYNAYGEELFDPAESRIDYLIGKTENKRRRAQKRPAQTKMDRSRPSIYVLESRVSTGDDQVSLPNLTR